MVFELAIIVDLVTINIAIKHFKYILFADENAGKLLNQPMATINGMLFGF